MTSTGSNLWITFSSLFMTRNEPEANAAFEDCSILKASLKRHAPDWQTAFAEYYHKRKPHIDVLADLCLENFIEMRDHVAAGSFRIMKRLEKVVQRLLPGYVRRKM